MISVRVDGVSLGHSGSAVLENIDFELQQGEFVGLFGPNGAGKTTLLRGLLGLVAPMAGRIEVLGAAARRGNPAIGYLPQTGGAIVPRLRVVDVLAASVRGHRWGFSFLGRAGRARIEQALERAGAGSLAGRPMCALSGGERQRVLIAQALIGTPRLLLLDEPLAGLDPRHQGEIVSLLREVQQVLGVTVLCSAHDINVLLPAMDRVLFVAGGGVALGPVAQVATGPVLRRLYGAPIDVVRAGGHIFVSRVAALSGAEG
jgi:zinc/manganese transport system ATP-binding protein